MSHPALHGPTLVRTALGVFAVLVGAACSDDGTGPSSVDPQVIEEVAFDSSLHIVLDEFTKLPSGVYVRTETEGTGDPVADGQEVNLVYAGFLTTGVAFDAGTYPYRVGQGNLIAGFVQGIEGQRIGEHRVIIIPPALGYGNSRVGSIPPGSVLIFEVIMEEPEEG